MQVYLLKYLLSFLNFLGRLFIYNNNPPAVREITSNVHYGRAEKRKRALDTIIQC
jgi:hypothetical protein